jgi:transcriptional regulator with XRE-family HTH domain
MSFSAIELSAEVDKLCRETGLTQRELAERAGIKPETLIKILGGHQTTSQVVVNSLRNAARVEVLNKNSGQTPAGSLREEAPEYKVGGGMDWMDLMLAAAELEARERKVPFDRESFLQTLIRMAREQKKFEVAGKAAEKLSQIFRSHTDARPSSNLPPGFVEGVGKALHQEVAGGGEGSSPSGAAGGSSAPAPPHTGRTGRRYSGPRSSPGEAPKPRAGDTESGHHKK